MCHGVGARGHGPGSRGHSAGARPSSGSSCQGGMDGEAGAGEQFEPDDTWQVGR